MYYYINAFLFLNEEMFKQVVYFLMINLKSGWVVSVKFVLKKEILIQAELPGCCDCHSEYLTLVKIDMKKCSVMLSKNLEVNYIFGLQYSQSRELLEIHHPLFHMVPHNPSRIHALNLSLVSMKIWYF